MHISESDLEFLIALVRVASENIMKYRDPELVVQYKNDDAFDPLTQADETTDELLRAAISDRFPDDEILSEENSDIPTNYGGRVWMIDPLDGTKEFVDGGDRFAVMIGLCVDGVPVFGIVAQPTSGDVYYGIKGTGSFLLRGELKHQLHVNNNGRISNATILVSRQSGEPRESEKFLQEIPFKAFVEDASFGLRVGVVAEGHAEFFVATNTRASKWDICGPQVILEEAGGTVTLRDGRPINYKQADKNIGESFVGSNTALHDELLVIIADMPA